MPLALLHPLNWYAGWSLLLLAMLVGTALGAFFHQDDFLGGYGSFRRRLLRLGHISLAALGMLNLLYAIAPTPPIGSGGWRASAAWLASICLVAGGTLMPAVCFLTAWRESARRWFVLPVLTLMIAVVMAMIGGGR
jgi:hypothetical protein